MKHVISLALLSLVACGGSSNNTTPDAASQLDSAGSDTGSGGCTAARATLLGSVNSVSTGNVTVLSSGSGTATLYIDASAGGIKNQTANPWIYVSLTSDSRVSITDPGSLTSTAWDLALKRQALYTNDGDGGPGSGGAVFIQSDFASVTSADATAATLGTEKFFDADWNAMTDPSGAPLTTFSSWYDYDMTTHVLTPTAGTWLVRGGTGRLYKLKIDSYYSNPDGSEGNGDGGTFKIEVGAL